VSFLLLPLSPCLTRRSLLNLLIKLEGFEDLLDRDFEPSGSDGDQEEHSTAGFNEDASTDPDETGSLAAVEGTSGFSASGPASETVS
jgi:hypothetical protein